MFYFFKRGRDTRAAADSPGFEIILTGTDGTERFERFATSEVHARWLELHATFQRDGWWGPATEDGRG